MIKTLLHNLARGGASVAVPVGRRRPVIPGNSVKKLLTLLAVTGLALVCGVAQSGTVYYVATNGNNSASGTSLTTPWLTISQAAATMTNGCTVYIRGGTYRETVVPANGGSSVNNRITYSAYTNEQPVITGSDIYTNWTSTGTNWSLPWTTNLYGDYGDFVFRREMVIVDGTVLTNVQSLNAVTPGSFYCDDPNNGNPPTHIWMITPDGTPPGGHVVECAWRNEAFAPSLSLGYFHVVGLTFTHCANRGLATLTGGYGATPMASFGMGGSLVESNVFEWCNGVGVFQSGSNNVYSGDVAQYNGEMGWGGPGTNNLVENCSSFGNNWKGYDDANEAGGGKFVASQNLTITNFTSGNNNGPGIWFDVFVYNSTVEGCLLYSNQLSGIQMEEGAWNTFRNDVVYGTRWYSYTGAGYLTMAACSNAIENCSFIGNEGEGVYIKSDTSRHLTNGFNLVFNNLFRDNVTSEYFTATTNGGEVHISYAAGDGSEIGDQFNGNIYCHTNATSNSQTFLRGSPYYFGNSLSSWQSNGYDLNSIIDDPLVVNWQADNGWHLTSGSPARGLGVTPPVPVPTDYDGNPRPSSGADSGADEYDTPPTASITIPTNNAVFIAPCDLAVTATAADSGGSVSNVILYLNGQQLHTENYSPYNWSSTSDAALSNMVPGNYSMVAVAMNTLGALGTSAVVNVTVVAPWASVTNGNFELPVLASMAQSTTPPYDPGWFSPNGVYQAWVIGAGRVTSDPPDYTNSQACEMIAGSFIYQSLGNYDASQGNSLNWGFQQVTASGTNIAVQISFYAQTGSFTGTAGSDIEGAAGVTPIGPDPTASFSVLPPGMLSRSNNGTLFLNGVTNGTPIWVRIGANGPSGTYGPIDNFTVSITNNPLPSPWQNQDVGTVGVAGGSSYSNGTFVVTGSGADIFGTADAFQYACQSGSGDCSIQARVASVQDINVWSKAGLMIRETLDAGALNAAIFVTPSNGINFQWRTNTDGVTTSSNAPSLTAPYWVKLARTGNSFTGYDSTNGSSWTAISTQTVVMATNVYLGLGVTSHTNTIQCTATIDNVTPTP